MKQQDSKQSPSGRIGKRSNSRAVGFPTPDQIRFSIQQLVADEEIDKAETLASEGLSAYPENEGVLAISGLVAIVRNDWARAVDLLDRLISIQGPRASDFTRMMYERARNCQAELEGNGLHAGRHDLAALPAQGN